VWFAEDQAALEISDVEVRTKLSLLGKQHCLPKGDTIAKVVLECFPPNVTFRRDLRSRLTSWNAF
jgi:hypothetical protein